MFKFSDYIDSKLGVPVLNEEQWSAMLSALPDREERTAQLVGAILDAGPSDIPARKLTLGECETKFKKLLNRDYKDFMIDVEPDSPFSQKYMDYKFDVGPLLGLIQLGHGSNVISDHFQRDNRMRCSGYDRMSSWDIWNGTDMSEEEHRAILRKLFLGLWRMGNKNKLGATQYQECFRLGGAMYTAAQFKVHTAKAVYDYFGANDVIDFSMGWGDRLAGWYTRKEPGVFVGCDPNEDVFLKYIEQATNYSTWRGEDYISNHGDDSFTITGEEKTVMAYRSPAEDIDWSKMPKVDLVFTSPPYFGTELYAKGSNHEEDQSWKRYNEDTEWFDGFMKPVLEGTSSCLREGGHLAINIIDVYFKRGERYRVCDHIFDYCASLGLEYQGVLGMRMKQRPKRFKDDEHKKEFMASNFIEPIWVWKKL